MQYMAGIHPTNAEASHSRHPWCRSSKNLVYRITLLKLGIGGVPPLWSLGSPPIYGMAEQVGKAPSLASSAGAGPKSLFPQFVREKNIFPPWLLFALRKPGPQLIVFTQSTKNIHPLPPHRSAVGYLIAPLCLLDPHVLWVPTLLSPPEGWVVPTMTLVSGSEPTGPGLLRIRVPPTTLLVVASAGIWRPHRLPSLQPSTWASGSCPFLNRNQKNRDTGLWHSRQTPT